METEIEDKKCSLLKLRLEMLTMVAMITQQGNSAYGQIWLASTRTSPLASSKPALSVSVSSAA